LVREQSSHVLRVQKTLEEANIKLDSVVTDLMGKIGRAIIEALIAGETNRSLAISQYCAAFSQHWNQSSRTTQLAFGLGRYAGPFRSRSCING
jgi:hypothetical protein